MKAVLVRVGMTLMLLAGLLGALASQAEAASNTAFLYIHTLKCNSQVDDLFEDCHNRRIEGFRYTLGGVERASDRNGTVRFAPGGPRSYWIKFNQSDYANYQGGYLYCENKTTGSTRIDGPVNSNSTGMALNLQPRQVLFCDLYLFTH
ncbi:MAG: hypothetical protein IT334_07355 [Thermomicrobiales bacterium]|nr:hypothetical protein [Thermomicrobiales bacterium]